MTVRFADWELFLWGKKIQFGRLNDLTCFNYLVVLAQPIGKLVHLATGLGEYSRFSKTAILFLTESFNADNSEVS